MHEKAALSPDKLTSASEKGKIVATGPVIREIGNEGSIRVDGGTLRKQVMRDLLAGDPHVDATKDFHLVDRPILLTPLIEFEPRCFCRDIVNSTDERKVYWTGVSSVTVCSGDEIQQVWPANRYGDGSVPLEQPMASRTSRCMRNSLLVGPGRGLAPGGSFFFCRCC